MDVGCIVTIANAWIALACTLGLAPGPKEGAAATRPSTGARPNVVVIMTDDQRADTLGCTGHRFIRTPNIDALARDGAIFQNSFAVTPRCCPSRATLLSGRYTHLTGVSTNGCDMCYDEIVLLPALLKERGYTTAFIGKWHMGGRADARPGFDHWVCYNDYKGQGVYFDATFNVNGKSQTVPEFSTDAVADFAVEWLGRTGDRPYFSWFVSRILTRHAIRRPGMKPCTKIWASTCPGVWMTTPRHCLRRCRGFNLRPIPCPRTLKRPSHRNPPDRCVRPFAPIAA